MCQKCDEYNKNLTDEQVHGIYHSVINGELERILNEKPDLGNTFLSFVLANLEAQIAEVTQQAAGQVALGITDRRHASTQIAQIQHEALIAAFFIGVRAKEQNMPLDLWHCDDTLDSDSPDFVNSCGHTNAEHAQVEHAMEEGKNTTVEVRAEHVTKPNLN